MSLDIDGDGIVSQQDLKMAKLFDTKARGTISSQEKAAAQLEMAKSYKATLLVRLTRAVEM